MFRSLNGRMLVVMAAVSVAGGASNAVAEPLTPEACEALKVERTKLEAAGVGHDLRRGPDWGRTRLTAARLGEVMRLISVTEQIAFRCRKPPEEVKAGGEATESAVTGSGVPHPVRKPTPAGKNVTSEGTSANMTAAAAKGGAIAPDGAVAPARKAPKPASAATAKPQASSAPAKGGLEQ